MSLRLDQLPVSATAPVDTDILPTVESVSTTHAHKSKTWATFMAAIGAYTQILTNKTLTTPTITTPTINAPWDGWIQVTETWAYASATTITVPTGAATRWCVGDKWKLTSNGVVLYGYISAVANTQLTVTGDALTNHTFTAVAVCKMKSPLGFDITKAEILTNKQLYTPTFYGTWDGWINANETWTYTSATSITVPSGATSRYQVSDKLKWTQNSTVYYAYIVEVASTTLTIAGNAFLNTGTYPCTLNYYSRESSPIGFPQWFTYTPTGIAASNVTLTGRFMLTSRLCIVEFHAAFTGAIAFTTMPTLPVTAGANIIGTVAATGTGATYDSSLTTYARGGLGPSIIANATTFSLITSANVPISATVNLTWANGDYIDANFSYEI